MMKESLKVQWKQSFSAVTKENIFILIIRNVERVTQPSEIVKSIFMVPCLI